MAAKAKGEPSAYALMQKNNKRIEKQKRQPSPRSQAVARGKCGGKLHGGREGVCQRPAGWGTTHPGLGKCRNHGGSVATHAASAARHQAVEFMGAPKDINPMDAIIWCIRVTAGEVEWLGNELVKITAKEEWFEHTVMGKQMHVLQRTRAEAQDRLVKYSKTALDLGLAERSVRLAEQFGQTIARLLEGIREDLELNTKQKERWPIVIRKHLILLQGGNVVETGESHRPLAAIPRRVGGSG
jgi:hypothetical protein